MVAALLAFFLGGFGAHKFYLGYNTEGIIILLVVWGGLVCFGVPTIIMALLVLIEAIIYLTKSDQEFYTTYVLNKRPWF
jgi:Predicted membrane protein